MAETIGWLTDKILITQLKIHHMGRQLERQDVDAAHLEMCRARLEILRRQSDDLKEEMVRLYRDMSSGKTKPKIYRQFKMYNDPRFRSKLK